MNTKNLIDRKEVNDYTDYSTLSKIDPNEVLLQAS